MNLFFVFILLLITKSKCSELKIEKQKFLKNANYQDILSNKKYTFSWNDLIMFIQFNDDNLVKQNKLSYCYSNITSKKIQNTSKEDVFCALLVVCTVIGKPVDAIAKSPHVTKEQEYERAIKEGAIEEDTEEYSREVNHFFGLGGLGLYLLRTENITKFCNINPYILNLIISYFNDSYSGLSSNQLSNSNKNFFLLLLLEPIFYYDYFDNRLNEFFKKWHHRKNAVDALMGLTYEEASKLKFNQNTKEFLYEYKDSFVLNDDYVRMKYIFLWNNLNLKREDEKNDKYFELIDRYDYLMQFYPIAKDYIELSCGDNLHYCNIISDFILNKKNLDEIDGNCMTFLGKKVSKYLEFDSCFEERLSKKYYQSDKYSLLTFCTSGILLLAILNAKKDINSRMLNDFTIKGSSAIFIGSSLFMLSNFLKKKNSRKILLDIKEDHKKKEASLNEQAK